VSVQTVRGTSLLEALVAMLLLGILAALVGGAFATARMQSDEAARWTNALLLAASGLEELRAAGNVPLLHEERGYRRRLARYARADKPGLEELVAEVSWQDTHEHSVELRTMVFRPALPEETRR